MLADELDYVVGVDTHRDQHVLAVVAAPTGALIDRCRLTRRATARRSALQSDMRQAHVCGRSKAQVITARAWPDV